jgi:hypothetical protein
MSSKRVPARDVVQPKLLKLGTSEVEREARAPEKRASRRAGVISQHTPLALRSNMNRSFATSFFLVLSMALVRG